MFEILAGLAVSLPLLICVNTAGSWTARNSVSNALREGCGVYLASLRTVADNDFACDDIQIDPTQPGERLSPLQGRSRGRYVGELTRDITSRAVAGFSQDETRSRY